MKKLCLLLFISAIATTLSAKKIALIVCIAKYPQQSGWQQIHSDNDAALLKSTLQQDFIIYTLQDQNANFQQIKDKLLFIAANAQKNDTVIIHFSCHGQQMLSSDNSAEPDGLDECLIPYDAYKQKSTQYNGQNHLTDNVLSSYIKKIMTKTGPKGIVMIIIDACHSDSMNRGDDSTYIRGTGDIFGLQDQSVAQSIRDRYRNLDNEPLTKTSSESDVLYISACQTYQNNYETKYGEKFFGSLSLCFCQAYQEIGIKDIPKLTELISKKMRLISQFGQKMAIRTTLKVDVNDKTVSGTDDKSELPSRGGNEEGPSTWFWIILMITILSLLWILKKIKK